MNNFKRYTFFTDWDGGTYIHQVNADNFSSAVSSWVELLVAHNDLNISPESMSQFIEILKESEFVDVTGFTSIWCTSIVFEEKLALTHVVLTAQS